MRHTPTFGVGILNYAHWAFLKILGLAFSFFQFAHVYFLLVVVFLFGQCLGMRFSPISNFFSLVSSHAFRDAPHSRFLVWGSKSKLTGLFKNVAFGPPPNLHTCILLVEICRFGTMLRMEILTNLFFFFLLRLCVRLQMPHTRDFGVVISKICLLDYLKMLQLALFSDLHTCISLVEVCRFAQYLGLRCSPIYIFFSLACFHAFSDAPHSRFWCGDPNQCLPNFLKMQLAALLQIYPRVFHFWESIDLDSSWVRYSRPYELSFFS